MDGDKIMVDDPSYAETWVNPNKIKEFLDGFGDYRSYSLEDRRKIWNKWSAFRTKKKVRISFERSLLRSFDFSKLDNKESWDFSFCDFHPDAHWPADMRYWKFIGAGLDDVHWGEAILAYADLSFASLKNAFLEKANLSYARLIGVDLRKADVMMADLRGVNISNSDLREAKFKKSKLFGAKILVSDLRGVNISNSDLREAEFKKSDLRETSFIGADIHGTSFIGADIRGANFSLSYFSSLETIFNGAKYNNKTIWPTR